jgi:hypothetical protein
VFFMPLQSSLFTLTKLAPSKLESSCQYFGGFQIRWI